MSEPTVYEIELRGHPGDRALGPVVDDFAVEATPGGNTRLVGVIRDPSHLSGLLAHFTSLNVDLVRLEACDDALTAHQTDPTHHTVTPSPTTPTSITPPPTPPTPTFDRKDPR